MTYQRSDTPYPFRPYPGTRRFERRIDERTASDIGDALRAAGVQAAALAMQHLQVDVSVALRVLAGKHDERGKQRRQVDQEAPPLP